MSEAPVAGDTLTATHRWFIGHGLSYFVPEERQAARDALRLGRTLPLLVLTGLSAAGAGAALAWVSDQFSFAPATLLTFGLLAGLWYALTALRARPIVTWALHRTFGGLRTLLPMMSRALPLLLLFVTFLFINAEVWEVAAALDGAVLWLVALLFGVLAGGFLLVRLPEEVDRTDDHVDDAFLRRACAGTPLERECARLVDDPDSTPTAYAEVTGYERWNLVIVLLIIQATQVLLLSLSVFVFFLVFGAIVMEPAIVANWTGDDPHNIPGLPNVSAELLQVSVFLAAFSTLYLTVATVTDEAYRTQFFGAVLRELERAVGVRAVYLALRAEPTAEAR
ncbi:hypothetical protein ACFP3Q_15645 [Nocardioides sp. GCM10027113]|uniref:hypothetical protein n=1 Tax=unclassified Nocardioides TaxID=2615069 RepID=UPI0036123C73